MSRPIDPESPVDSQGNAGPPVEQNGGVSAQTQQRLAAQGGASIAGLPWEFNPPLHPHNFHYRVDFTTEEKQMVGKTYDQYLDQSTVGQKVADQTALRLGRITMSDRTENFTMKEQIRWGFRFLANPETWSGGSKFNQNIAINAGPSKFPLRISVGLEVISFKLVLNRVPDVIGLSVAPTDYTPNITPDQLDELRRRGTNYDLEYLFRVANTNRAPTVDGQMTADVGVLLPGICLLTLGGIQYRGRILLINAHHTKFSAHMVPVYTEVDIQFQRTLDMADDKFTSFAKGGGWDVNDAGGLGSSSTGSVNTSGGVGGVGQGNTSAEQVWHGLKAQGFTEQAAAGILGNLQQESGVNPLSKQAGGPGRGIMQWSEGARWTTLTNWAQGQNLNPWDLNAQFQFMIKELRDGGWYETLKGMTDINTAVKYFHDKMERSADTSMDRRNSYAQFYFNLYTGK